MVVIYLWFTLVILVVFYTGIEGTMRGVEYLDISLRYAWVKMRMYFMKKRLEKNLMVYHNGEWKSFNEVRKSNTK